MKPYICASAGHRGILRKASPIALTHVELAREARKAGLAEHQRQYLIGQLVRLLNDDHFAGFVPADDLPSAARREMYEAASRNSVSARTLTWWYSGCSLYVSMESTTFTAILTATCGQQMPCITVTLDGTASIRRSNDPK